MKKREQIKALQAECDRLAKERDAARLAARQADATIGRLRAEAARRTNLFGAVRTEFHRKWEWLLDAVKLP